MLITVFHLEDRLLHDAMKLMRLDLWRLEEFKKKQNFGLGGSKFIAISPVN